MGAYVIDILLATYEGEAFLEEQLLSIMAQTVSDWNLYISDDGSTDATPHIARRFARRDERIHVLPHHEPFGGARKNFMHLLRHSTAPYCMFCDQDDVWLPNKIELTLQRMHELEERYATDVPLMVFTDMIVVDAELNVLRDSFERQIYVDPNRTGLMQLISVPVAAGCTMMLNEALRNKTLETPRDQPMDMHDWWISLVAAAFGHIGHVDEPTSLYRQHASNTIGANDKTTIRTFGTFSMDAASADINRAFALAKSFCDVYYDQLSPRDQRRISSFTSVSTAPRLLRIPRMIRGRSWKRGAVRKMGEAVVLLLMKMEDFPLDSK